MFGNIKYYLVTILCGFLFFSCAREEEESNESIQKRILDAYLEVNYPNKNYEVTKSGLVVLSQEEGDGKQPVSGNAAYIRYSVKSLSGNYEKTTIKEMAEKLGTYSPSEYYGPILAEIGYGKISRGVHEAICMMKEGGKITVIIPPFLSSYDYSKEFNYGYTIDETPLSSTNDIYEIELEHAITDIFRFQKDSLESFRDINYPGVDSIVTGYYFKKLSGTEKDTITHDESANVWYVGKLLDGYVFDTNIEDTAKKYGLYDMSKTYNPLTVNYESTFEEMSSETNESGEGYVTGFARALKSMTYGDHAVTFFWSNMGYKEKEQDGIPAYSMLFFEIFVEKNE